ncbi:TetR/AcrR family transcriptional regulator [Actinoallomurus sp. NBC_01490]|uniref:TetR/AcrR family transcriptional regulator n=1 Tax=Actinoallomurus sp. NBC_01490 TaxID=2903557 RepID=UPI002E32B2A7|nr:TetR/AcrR family transcriptional regulator [Actinoallomurus sp. NBC_01490]
MASIRHKKDAVLDATRDCVLAVGVRRTTLTDVARRAGVSRMTIYRRWPDVRTLVGDLMTREWATVVAAVAPPEDGSPVRAQAVEALVAGVAALRAHPLFHKIMEVDPEVLLPYILERRGTSQDAMLRAIEATLRAGHRDGSVRAGDPARQARSLLLVLQSFAMSGHIMTGDGPALSAAAFDEELRQILERYLAP